MLIRNLKIIVSPSMHSCFWLKVIPN